LHAFYLHVSKTNIVDSYIWSIAVLF